MSISSTVRCCTLCLAALLSLPGCAVVEVAGATAGAAISVAGAVVSTGVSVTGKVIGKTIDAVTPSGEGK
jgi:hypothetical protein